MPRNSVSAALSKQGTVKYLYYRPKHWLYEKIKKNIIKKANFPRNTVTLGHSFEMPSDQSTFANPILTLNIKLNFA